MVQCVWTYLALEHIFGLKIPNGSELSEPDKSKRIVRQAVLILIESAPATAVHGGWPHGGGCTQYHSAAESRIHPVV